MVNVPKTRRTYWSVFRSDAFRRRSLIPLRYSKGKTCKKHTPHKVTQYKTGKASTFAQGKRRYDRKQSGSSRSPSLSPHTTAAASARADEWLYRIRRTDQARVPQEGQDDQEGCSSIGFVHSLDMTPNPFHDRPRGVLDSESTTSRPAGRFSCFSIFLILLPLTHSVLYATQSAQRARPRCRWYLNAVNRAPIFVDFEETARLIRFVLQFRARRRQEDEGSCSGILSDHVDVSLALVAVDSVDCQRIVILIATFLPAPSLVRLAHSEQSSRSPTTIFCSAEPDSRTKGVFDDGDVMNSTGKTILAQFLLSFRFRLTRRSKRTLPSRQSTRIPSRAPAVAHRRF